MGIPPKKLATSPEQVFGWS